MKLLVLKKFNNYFNRKIIKYSSTADYIAAASAYSIVSDFNFNPNDAVRTTIVLGKGDLEGFFDFEKTNAADYLVCYYETTTNNVTTETIDSRWFITEVVRTRSGQYEISLKRDSIADNLDTLYNAPAFIKKGTVSDDNPLIVNSEGISVNQIKNDEVLLKDKTGSSWIVGYMAKNAPSTSISAQIPTNSDFYYETIENIAAELGVSSADLNTVLTTATDNQSYFVNDNIEVVGWINYVDNSSLEYKIIAGSSDGLQSFTYVTTPPLLQRHTPTSDCFAKCVERMYSGVLNTNKVLNLWKGQCNDNKTAIKNAWQTIVHHPLLTRKVYNKLDTLARNRTLIYKQGIYYTVNVGTVNGPTNTGDQYFSSSISVPFNTICTNVVNSYNQGLNPSTTTHLELLSGGKIFINYNELIATFYLEEVTDMSDIPGITVTMSTTRNPIYDQPYDMFAIPANNTAIVNGANTYEVIGDYAQKIAMKLVEELTQSNIYDVQLLPYCPIPSIAGNNLINVTDLTSGYDYDFITQTGAHAKQYKTDYCGYNEYEYGRYEAILFWDTGLQAADILDYGYEILDGEQLIHSPGMYGLNIDNQRRLIFHGLIEDWQDADHIQVRMWYEYASSDPVIKSIVIYPKSNSFNINLNYNLELKDSMKIESQCNNYRLVSPNYQGSFDFNVAKNGGSVNGFIAECTYKPYTPYIKVAPNFSWLYGTNFGDARGLICGGDFSIGLMESKWQEFQLQNKNYQNIFNREIQSLDIAQSIQREQQYTTGFIKQFADSGAGFVTGFMAGGPWAGAAGATLAGGMSTYGYVKDNQLMEKQLIDQRQLQFDKFHMQLGNIQALPYTLTKIGAFTINSKIWPFLEYYTCSKVEKDALAQKIEYEGMTIGIVDLLGEYLRDGYVQADLIRNNEIIDDSHLLDDIYIELSKGVYM